MSLPQGHTKIGRFNPRGNLIVADDPPRCTGPTAHDCRMFSQICNFLVPFAQKDVRFDGGRWDERRKLGKLKA
jgi:hypothetical protein